MSYGAAPSDQISKPLTSPAWWKFGCKASKSTTRVLARTFFEAQRLSAVKLGTTAEHLECLDNPVLNAGKRRS